MGAPHKKKHLGNNFCILFLPMGPYAILTLFRKHDLSVVQQVEGSAWQRITAQSGDRSRAD